MKKIFLPILLTALALASIQSCNMSEVMLQAAVEKANESCPDDIDDDMVLAGMAYDGQYVVYSIECDGEKCVLDQVFVTPELRQTTIDELLANEASDENLQAFLSLVRKAKAGIIYHYYIPDTEMEMEVKIEPDEL